MNALEQKNLYLNDKFQCMNESCLIYLITIEIKLIELCLLLLFVTDNKSITKNMIKIGRKIFHNLDF